MEPELVVSHGPYNITVMAISGHLSMGILDVSVHFTKEGHWYLNRIVVRQPRQGLGPKLLRRLRQAFEERQTVHPEWVQKGPLIVEPGGYGSDYEGLVRFYTREGFQKSPEGECFVLEV